MNPSTQPMGKNTRHTLSTTALFNENHMRAWQSLFIALMSLYQHTHTIMPSHRLKYTVYNIIAAAVPCPLTQSLITAHTVWRGGSPAKASLLLWLGTVPSRGPRMAQPLSVMKGIEQLEVSDNYFPISGIDVTMLRQPETSLKRLWFSTRVWIYVSLISSIIFDSL